MEESIRKLLHGYKNFKNFYFSSHTKLYRQLQNGQHPKVLVIACSDSRVDPALITGCSPGDIFVIRNVANLIPPYEHHIESLHHGTSAALEYAVTALNVEHIIVLGHSDCGGIGALMAREEKGGGGEFLGPWLDLAEAAKEEVNRNLGFACDATRRHACEELSLVLTLENLLTFPWIRERVEADRLALHAWFFHIANGQLFELDQQERRFLPLEEPPHFDH